MSQLLIYLLISLAALAIGYLIGLLLTKGKVQEFKGKYELLDQNYRKDQQELNLIRIEKQELLVKNTSLQSDVLNLNKSIEQGKQDLEKLQEKFSQEFEVLANKIFEDKSTKFTHQNRENIKNILEPLEKKIKDFEEKVSSSQKESVGMHSALKEQLDQIKQLNQQMSKEALNLTKALKGDSKAQGDWGETQLEILLEKANLVKEIHYSTQGGYRDEEGKLKKPDFIINLPDNRHLIIDSKVSLTSYEAFSSEENDEIKTQYLKKHLESLKKHIKELSDKKYETLYGINSPDYVLMFVPIEPALMVALGQNNNLYLEALDKNIVLVSTSTLLATLSTISSMWRQENQKRNVLEIAEQAGRLYDQFVNLTDDLIKVGNQLKTVQGSYDTSMKKLTGRGNLVSKVEKIKKLGAKTTKTLNQNLLDRATEE